MARYPLDNNPRISSTHGQRTNMGTFGRHLGIDRVVVNQPFYAPSNGRIINIVRSASLGLYIEAEFLGYHWRFAHLSSSNVRAGQAVKEGQQLGVTGNSGITTGPHLHYDARKLGTAWNASFNNYVDPDKVIAQAIEASKPKMPAVGSKVLFNTDPRTVFNPGTTSQSGTLRNDGKEPHIVRGYDPKFPYRILIQTASGGSKYQGDYKAIALYYTSGQLINGWRQL